MEVKEFRFLNKDDINDPKKYANWSRAYEYPMVLDRIKKYNIQNISIHNSSWGFEGIHLIFRDQLDTIGECVHSDIVKSNFRDTYFYDITTEHKEFQEKFDYVLNVSTIEHLPNKEKQIAALNNLFKQVKVGGHLIVTFDYPRVNLDMIEKWTESKCDTNLNSRLNGRNSVVVSERYKDLNIVFLIIKK